MTERLLTFTKQGLRTIAFAYIDYPTLPRDDDGNITDVPEYTNLIFIGFVGIKV